MINNKFNLIQSNGLEVVSIKKYIQVSNKELILTK